MFKKIITPFLVAPIILGVTSCGDDINREINWNAEEFTIEHDEFLVSRNTHDTANSIRQQGFANQGAVDAAVRSFLSANNIFEHNGILFNKTIRSQISYTDDAGDSQILILEADFSVIGTVANFKRNFLIEQISLNHPSHNILSPQTILDFVGISADDRIVEASYTRGVFIDRFSDDIFNKMMNSNDLTLPTTVNGFPVIEIRNLAFNNQNIRNVNLNHMEHLRTIGNQAFRHNEISSLSINNLSDLTLIGQHAFADNYLDTLSLVGLTSIATIGANAFINNLLTRVEIIRLTALTGLLAAVFTNNIISNWTFDTLPRLTDQSFTAFINNMVTITNIEIRNANGWLSPNMYAFLTCRDPENINLPARGFRINISR